MFTYLHTTLPADGSAVFNWIIGIVLCAIAGYLSHSFAQSGEKFYSTWNTPPGHHRDNAKLLRNWTPHEFYISNDILRKLVCIPKREHIFGYYKSLHELIWFSIFAVSFLVPIVSVVMWSPALCFASGMLLTEVLFAEGIAEIIEYKMSGLPVLKPSFDLSKGAPYSIEGKEPTIATIDIKTYFSKGKTALIDIILLIYYPLSFSIILAITKIIATALVP